MIVDVCVVCEYDESGRFWSCFFPPLEFFFLISTNQKVPLSSFFFVSIKNL